MSYFSTFNPFSRSSPRPSDSPSASTSAPSSSSSSPSSSADSDQTSAQDQQSQPPLTSRPHIQNSSKLILAGATFFVLSALVTRRSLNRRRIATVPPFYTTASYHRPPVNGAIEAFEALNIATINVLSISMLSVGGCMYGFGIETLEDLRRAVRGGLGVDGTGRTEQDLEEELEEWVVDVMGRKEKKEKAGRDRVDERGRDRGL